MADMDLIFPSWTQHERIAAALESIALNGGSSDAAVLDAACGPIKIKRGKSCSPWAASAGQGLYAPWLVFGCKRIGYCAQGG